MFTFKQLIGKCGPYYKCNEAFFKAFVQRRKLSVTGAFVQSYEHVLVEKENKIMIISINRPSKKNCVNRATARELYSAFKVFEEDRDAAVGILRGTGDTFCSGYDLSEVAKFDDEEWKEFEKELNFSEGHAPMGPSRLTLSKPMIAAVSGHAVAGGLELALLCDLRVAEDDAIFGVFCRRHGVPLIDGGTVRLHKLIGLSRALDLILTGRPVDAKEAYTIGLVNRIVPKGELLQSATKLAQEIAEFPQDCLRADLHSARHSALASTSLEDALKFEFNNGIKVILKESVMGARKFVSDS